MLVYLSVSLLDFLFIHLSIQPSTYPPIHWPIWKWRTENTLNVMTGQWEDECGRERWACSMVSRRVVRDELAGVSGAQMSSLLRGRGKGFGVSGEPLHSSHWLPGRTYSLFNSQTSSHCLSCVWWSINVWWSSKWAQPSSVCVVPLLDQLEWFHVLDWTCPPPGLREIGGSVYD